jgi:hypothetical protein
VHFSQYTSGCFQQGIQKVLDVRFHPGGEPLLAVSCNEVRQPFFKRYVVVILIAFVRSFMQADKNTSKTGGFCSVLLAICVAVNFDLLMMTASPRVVVV